MLPNGECPVTVLLPYEITLFSNLVFDAIIVSFVLLPYEITLFSNAKLTEEKGGYSFTTL